MAAQNPIGPEQLVRTLFLIIVAGAAMFIGLTAVMIMT